MKELVHEMLTFLMGFGYWGIMLGLAVEVIPSEIVLAYAGFMVGQGRINAAEAVLFGTIGIIIAQMILYWIGRYGGRPFLEKYGKYLMISRKHLDTAESWFNKYGSGIVFTGRFIPVLRQAVSLPAGMARMSVLRFNLYTILATIPWCILFIQLGKSLGANWEQIDQKAGPYMNAALWAAVCLTGLYFLYKLVFTGKKTEG